jgi:hypothetical protein
MGGHATLSHSQRMSVTHSPELISTFPPRDFGCKTEHIINAALEQHDTIATRVLANGARACAFSPINSR